MVCEWPAGRTDRGAYTPKPSPPRQGTGPRGLPACRAPHARGPAPGLSLSGERCRCGDVADVAPIALAPLAPHAMRAVGVGPDPRRPMGLRGPASSRPRPGRAVCVPRRGAPPVAARPYLPSALLLPTPPSRRRPLVCAGVTATGGRPTSPPPASPPPPSPSTPPSLPLTLTAAQLAALTEDVHASPFDPPSPVTSLAELASALGTDSTAGLADASPPALAARRAAYGANAVAARPEVSLWQLVVDAASDPTVLVLLACGAASLGLELGLAPDGGATDTAPRWIEGAAILAAVVLVVGVTALNNWQKEAQFRDLSALADDCEVSVLRAGVAARVPSSDLVVGDLILLEAGDVLPADGVAAAVAGVRVDESALTGESVDVSKVVGSAMLSGAKVLEGNGCMLVTAVGPRSHAGSILAAVTGVGSDADPSPTAGLREQTALEAKLAVLAGQIGRAGAVAAGAVAVALGGPVAGDVLGGVRTLDASAARDALHALVTALTVLVVAVPEGLPLAVTVALAYSVKRMLADHNLVRRLSAAETMGCATVVCTDKTGTLTCR